MTDHNQDDIDGLIEFAETLPDDLNSDACMLLTFGEAALMEQIVAYDGLIVPHTAIAAIRMALCLEQGGLVTIERRAKDFLVSAVRPGEEG